MPSAAHATSPVLAAAVRSTSVRCRALCKWVSKAWKATSKATGACMAGRTRPSIITRAITTPPGARNLARTCCWRLPVPSAKNLSSAGLTEADVCLGDRFALGTAVVEVSQLRQPCWKLSDRFGVRELARRVQETGRTGWYYRVLQPGSVAAGDLLTLQARPYPQWTLSRLQQGAVCTPGRCCRRHCGVAAAVGTVMACAVRTSPATQ